MKLSDIQNALMLKPADGAVLALEDGLTQSAAAGAFLGVLGPTLLASLEFSSSVNSRSEYTSSSSLSSEKKYTFQICSTKTTVCAFTGFLGHFEKTQGLKKHYLAESYVFPFGVCSTSYQ